MPSHTSPLLCRAALLLATALAGCASPEGRDVEQVDATTQDVDLDAPIRESSLVERATPIDQDAFAHTFDDAGCRAFYRQYNDEPGIHIDPPAVITYDTVPPCRGNHYPIWLRYGTYRAPVNPSYWVHNLEHGSIAVLYRCIGDCTALRDQLEQFVASLEPEAACVGRGVPRRIVLLPNPDIDTNVAAASWAWTYGADCFDRASLEAFIRFRTGHGPEDTCGDGDYVP